MAGEKGRNAWVALAGSPRGKAPLGKPCKVVALAMVLVVTTLFMLQNVYVWCEAPASSGQHLGEAGGNVSSWGSPGPFKTMLCIASQRYMGMSSASSEFFQNLKSALNCRGGAEAADGDSSSRFAYADEQSWKSQWERRNLSVVVGKEPEALREMLEASQLKIVDTRRLLTTLTSGPSSCIRRPGPVMLALPSHGVVACPVLWQCQRQTPKVGVLCWDSKFFDTFTPETLPTEGGRFVTPGLGETTIYNYGEHLGALMFIAQVYSNSHAQVFDSSHLFLKGGCWEKRKDPLFESPEATPIVRLELAINLCSSHADSQFHGLVELLGRVALLLPAIRALPTARLLVTKRDYPHISAFFQLLGFPAGLAAGLDVQVMQPREVAYADMMVVAHSPGCGHSSGSVWRHIRQEHFKVGASPLEWAGDPTSNSPWYVVLAERKGTRSIVQHEALLAGLVAALGEARVKLFSDRVVWSLAATQELFRGASILVAAHGAGLSNMVFMPQRASVVEVRPTNFSNSCYHALADALYFSYYRFDSPGVKSSSLDVDVEQMVLLVSDIVRAKGRPVHFYDQLDRRRKRRRL